MSLRNIKYYEPAIRSNRNALVIQQIQFEANASDPTDADLAAGRLHWKTSTGLRFYDGSTWYTIPTSTSGGALNSWDAMYALDKSLTINSTTLTFNLTHATGDGLTISSGAVAGALLQFGNGGSGPDIQGTSDTWSVSKAGAATVASLVLGGDITATAAAIDCDLKDDEASALSFDATGKAGIIDIVTTNAGEGVTMSGLLTVAGVLTASTGLASSDGACTFTDNSNAANGITFVNDTATTYGNASDAGPVHFGSATLSTGHLLTLSLDASELAGGSYIRCWEQDGAAAVWTVGEAGLTTIGGAASGTDALVITAGDILVTSGNAVMTVGDLSLDDGSITVIDADNAVSLSVTNDTATSASVVVLAGAGVHTGTTTTSWMTITPSGMATGTGVYGVFAGMTTGKGVHLVGDATQTTGSVLYVENTGVSSALTSGTVATFSHVSSAVGGAVNKIGAVVSITSARTVNTGGNTADDFDCLSVIKTTTRTAGTAATAGSALYVQVVTTGTVTETSNGIEVVMDSGGTGAGISLTHAATGGVALNLVSASTTVSDAVLTGSGIKETTKAVLEITNGTAANKAGSSLLRVASGASTPAAATSYLTEFTYAASTMTNNPITMQVNSGSSTGASINVTGSGVNYSLSTFNTNAGAVGVKWYAQQTSATPADNDVVFTLDMAGVSSVATARIFGSLKTTATDITDGTEDGKIDLQVMVAGTLTSALYIQSSAANATAIADSMLADIGATTFTGVAAATDAVIMTNGDLALSAGGINQTTTSDMYAIDLVVNNSGASQATARITQDHTAGAQAVLHLKQDDTDEPYIEFTGAAAITSATAGANGDVPAQVVGYINVDVDGTDRRIPYYAA